MADVLLFHHAQGLTPGCVALADRLRAAGHTVHTPDLYEGNVFATLPEGLGYLRETTFDTILARGRAAAEGLPDALAYVGLSLGVMPAQLLAQTRSGARAAVLAHSFVAPAEFGGPWPEGVALQIHMAEGDPEVNPPQTDLADARAAGVGELFLYPGDTHLFTDESLPDHDPAAAGLFVDRTLDLLSAF